ncbi:RagB/SusD family nutrient uptake outer membrane protein [Mucilaginibacter paludis]|uniref:RagB/SusD domain-containing protein n=1 Tax=Mucilaginibacter paludis DSM 18603 TaxID=714943 RepID=H1Y883_9SPHI|nr:RagB/SusD family nutrient uptake outer membrane protein [Mucilaginibacter paludis]EHQ24902.1 RagB/SusD domain-containing protein [Mucilaginibacter paludis DSM 18603]
MKKYILTLVLLTTLLGGCTKSFIDLKPQSNVAVADFYQTKTDFLTAINGTYASLQSNAIYGNDYLTLTENRADNVVDNFPSTNGGLKYNIDQFLEGTTNTVPGNAWQAFYNTIYDSNVILNRIGDVSFDDATKKRIIGEASFIRALCYFNLVRLFGKLPLVTTEITAADAKVLTRSDVSVVYNQIEADLKSAALNLPVSYTGADIGRATSGAAKAMLGKVYLTEKKYPQAASILNDVITGNAYQLLSNYSDVFSTSNKNNAEIIFAVKFLKGGVGQGHPLWIQANGGIDSVVAPNLKKAYPVGDKRLSLVYSGKPSGTSIICAVKFFDAIGTGNDAGNDFIVIRYADVLLMYAEALNEVAYDATGSNGALSNLNKVRLRAKIPAYTLTDLPDQTTFRNAIYKERNLELALEGDRWFDLIRTGNAITAMAAVGIKIQPYQLLYAVPQSEISVINNPAIFPQNPGY